MVKVKNTNIKKRYEIHSKLALKRVENKVSITDFEQISTMSNFKDA